MKTASEAEQALEARRAARRAAMPIVSAFVNEVRETFPDVTVIYAHENGITVGRRQNNESAFTIPCNYRKPAEGWPK